MSSATRPAYPDDWLQIANAIKQRAGWKCEHCHHPHDPKAGYTLTVHHRDGNPFNNDPSNTRALCQRCHMIAAAHQSRYGPQYRDQPTLFDTKGDTP
jgi:hypothetical protein